MIKDEETSVDDLAESGLSPQRSILPASEDPTADHLGTLLTQHLLFDAAIDPNRAGLRQIFEAAASSVRDVLSRRWIQTSEHYDAVNLKRVYHLSMEFLIGRSLANNVANMMLKPALEQAVRDKALDWTCVDAPCLARRF